MGWAKITAELDALEIVELREEPDQDILPDSEVALSLWKGPMTTRMSARHPPDSMAEMSENIVIATFCVDYEDRAGSRRRSQCSCDRNFIAAHATNDRDCREHASIKLGSTEATGKYSKILMFLNGIVKGLVICA
jgi:hypothetical protein